MSPLPGKALPHLWVAKPVAGCTKRCGQGTEEITGPGVRKWRDSKAPDDSLLVARAVRFSLGSKHLNYVQDSRTRCRGSQTCRIGRNAKGIPGDLGMILHIFGYH
jgi:hypothetical protein